MKKTVERDLERIYSGLTEEEISKFEDATILFTGGAGFLGFYFINFFGELKERLKLKKVICLDNFKTGRPIWLDRLSDEGKVELHDFNVITDKISDIQAAAEADYVYHMASIASPTFYRQFPIETLDANTQGLRSLLDYYIDKNIKGFVFFSSSEIYGNPEPEHIPTPESYRGSVSCQGPRACYDESKRFCETICYLYNQKYNIPITIIRPFNNYGPGMRLNDARVPADFALAAYENRNIEILSDGRPSRTFCYITDSITGFIKALLHAEKGFDTFNIGNDNPEISVRKLAEIYKDKAKEVFGYDISVNFAKADDPEYLTNNPDRRCPDIGHARAELGYSPKVSTEDGVKYYLEFIKESTREELIW